MKFELLRKILIFSTLTLIFSNFSFSQLRGPLEEPYIPGHVIIQINEDVDIEKFTNQLPAQYGFSVNRQLSKIMRAWLLEFDIETLGQLEALRLMYDYPEVSIAQNNHIVEVRATVPNDPDYGDQWHHKNTGQNGGTLGADIKSEEAWDITTGGKNANGDDIVVCILEGVDFSHNDLQDNHWTNTDEIPGNGIDDDNNGFIDDINGWNVGNNSGDLTTGATGHGTNVAGMIGATGDNNVGVVGANWDVKMMNVIGYSTNSEASVVSAYEYPLVQRQRYNATNGEEGAFVVSTNASWGIDNANPDNYPIWCAFYDTLGKYGILNCGATSNSNINVDVSGDMPTACPSQFMVGVGRSDRNDNFQGGYGATTINLAAPGVNVTTTANGNGYTSTTGTSFSSPLTAGVIALMYSIPCPNFMSIVFSDPEAAADLVFNALMDGTDERPALVGNFVTGGRLNAKNAIDLLMEEVCSVCSTPSDIETSAISANSATITYSENEDIGEYKIFYREVGFNQWNTIITTGNEVELTNLNSCSEYEYYMEVLCDSELSEPSTIFNFTTEGCDDCLTTDYCEVTVSNPGLEVAIWSPVSLEGDLVNYTETSGWGGDIEEGYIYGELVLVDDGSAAPSEGCNTLINTAELNGKIAVALRGSCNFTAKAMNAQDAGAIGLIIVNNTTDMIQLGGNDPDVEIPVIKITQTQGNEIITALENEEEIIAMIGNQNEFISSFEWDNVSENSGDNNGYFSSNTLLEATVDEAITFSVTPGFDGPELSYGVQIWVDLDQNGTFETNEKLYESTDPVNGDLTDVITVPTSAEAGTTKLRVVMGYQGIGSNDLPDACVDFSSGEVEDYCLEVLDDEICNIDLTVTPSAPSCGNVFNGSIELDVNDDVNNYTFEWTNGLSGHEITSLAAGNYTVTITNLAACDTTVSLTLNSDDGVSIDLIAKTDASCDGVANGSIEVEGIGSSSYDYNWSNEATTALNDELEPGTYILTLTGENGCLAQNVYTIEALENIEIEASITTPTCIDSEDGSIEIEVVNGDGDMTFQWTDGPASSLLDEVGNGEYEVTVSSDNGCIATGTYTLESEGEEPTAGLAEIGTGGVTKNFVNESENAVTYEWDFGDGTTADSENATHTYEESGTFDVCLTAINDCGEDTECIQVTVTEEDLSTQDQEWTKEIKVFPNPTQEIVNLYVPNIKYGKLTILDATGKIVLTHSIDSEVTTINVAHLVTGLYLYTITNTENQSIYTQKLSVR